MGLDILSEMALEPSEEARHPPAASHATLSGGCSQSSGLSRELLSQPAPGLSHKQRLEWLQERRRGGLWVQCDDCSRWRHLPHALDAHDLPPRWQCTMHPDPNLANCSVPEKPLRVYEEEDLIHGEYAAGSVVWARMRGYPWWPALVCDCPDTEQYYWLDGFSDIPTQYNVVFFDEPDVTRAWISPEQMKPYKNKKQFELKPKDNKYKSRLRVATKQADDAKKLPIKERLTKYSFIARYKGAIVSPKDDKKEIKKHQLRLKRKFKLNFDDTDDEFLKRNSKSTKIILGSIPAANSVIDKSPTEQSSIFDNDTSKTYVPGTKSQESTQLTNTTTPAGSKTLGMSIESGSDDFEY